MATWKEINDAVADDRGPHAVEHMRVTMQGARLECRCGKVFADRDQHAAASAWLEHRAQRAAFPNGQERR